MAKKRATRWQKTRIPNLKLNTDNDEYYTVVRDPANPPDGKLYERHFTTVWSVAELKHSEFMAEHRKKSRTEGGSAADRSTTLPDLFAAYRARMNDSEAFKPKTKVSYETALKWLEKHTSAFITGRVVSFSPDDAERWWNLICKKRESVSQSNHALVVLKGVFKLAQNLRLRTDNPFEPYKASKIPRRNYELPTMAQFEELVRHMATKKAKGRDQLVKNAVQSSRMARGLCYSGVRVGELIWIRRQHVDFTKGEIRIVGHPKTGCKSGRAATQDRGERDIPLTPPMRNLIMEIIADTEDIQPDTLLFPGKSCDTAMHKAAQAIKCPRLTHHALRHLFCTICMESGVPAAIVAVVLGHKDGGRLVADIYSNIRMPAVQSAMAKVQFGLPAPSPKITSITQAA